MNRDPTVLKIDGMYCCYYYSDTEQGRNRIIAARISTDLIHWSDYTNVKQCGSPVSLYAISPFDVERSG